MKIQIAIQTWGFNKRLCWMLSSILQQVPAGDYPVPEISLNLAYIRHKGTEEVVRVFYAQGMKFQFVTYKSYEKGFAHRGLVRNEQLKVCDADWVMLADSDMVYPPDFFAKVGHELETRYKDSPHCLFLQRLSEPEAEAEALVNAPDITYPCIIDNAHARASNMTFRACRNVGAGYCQFANMEQLRKNHGGLYQPVDRILDGAIGTSLINKSDRNFRRTLGAEAMVVPDVKLQIHLQHPRQKNDYPK